MNMDALKQLKDIHMPAAQAWWYLPWGVWILVGLCCLVLVFVMVFRNTVKRRYQASKFQKTRQHAIEHEINDIEKTYQQTGDALAMIGAVSVLLRRVSITLFPDANVAGLIQRDWLQFLDSQWSQQLPEVSFSSDTMANLLSTAAYRKTADQQLQADAEALLTLAHRWLHEVAHVTA